MFDRILVPLDGSGFSEQALPFAFDAAEEAGVSARAALLHGPIVDALDGYANRFGVDLVVMSTHGRGGISRVRLGSVAEAIVRRSHRPVLTFRPDTETGLGAHAARFGQILIPLDGSETSERVLGPAVEFARAMGASCTLLRVVSPIYLIGDPFPAALSVDAVALERGRTDAASYLERIAAPLRAGPLGIRTEVVTHDQPAAAILEHAGKGGADLIAMATSGRGGWRRLVLGSVADKVLRAAAVPVLLVCPAGEPPEKAASRSTNYSLRAHPPSP